MGRKVYGWGGGDVGREKSVLKVKQCGLIVSNIIVIEF